MANNNNVKFSLKTILAAGGLALGVATMVAGLMGSIYCTKAEMAEVKGEAKDDMSKVELKVVLRMAKADWEIETMATRIKNIEKRQIQMGENITKLLARLRVQPAEPPYLAPMPMRPTGVIPE